MRLPTRLEVQTRVLRRRVRRMSPEEMLAWVDAAGYEMRRALAEYVRTQAPEQLGEFDRGLAVLVAMSETLHGQRD